jgi:hypothetical protein
MFKRLLKAVLSPSLWLVVVIGLLTLGAGAFALQLKFSNDFLKFLPNDHPALQTYRQVTEKFDEGEAYFIVINKELTPLEEKELTRKFRELEPEGIKQVLPPSALKSSAFFTPHQPDSAGFVLKTKIGIGFSQKTISLTQKIQDILKSRVGSEFYAISGVPYLNSFIQQLMIKELIKLTPLAFLIILLVLFWAFRSGRGVILPALVSVLAIIWALGLMQILGFQLSILSVALPVVLLVISNADGIHLLTRYNEKQGDILAALQETARPIVLTTLTTMAGFLALTTAPTSIIREFGIISAAGILFAMVFSLTLMPAILARLPKPKSIDFHQDQKDLLEKILKAFSFVSLKSSFLLVLGLGLILGFSLVAGLSKLEINNGFLTYLQERSLAVKNTEIIEKAFGGSLDLKIALEGPVSSNKIEDFKSFLGGQELLGKPAQQKQDEALLLDVPVKSARLPEVKQAILQVQNYLSQELDPENFQITGSSVIVKEVGETIVSSQIKSLAVSMAAILLLLLMLFRSWIWGFLAIVPLAFALSGEFGIMGLAGLDLDIGTVMVAAVVMGLGVDFSIHYLSRLRAELKKKPLAQAILVTSATTGKGIAINAAALSLGFLVLLFSEFKVLANFGLMLAVSTALALLATFFLLPAVLLFKR